MKIKKITPVRLSGLRYDITVANDHNFFANGTLVHNCQNMIGQLARIQDETFEVTVKLDGSSMTVFHMNPSCKHFSFAKEDVQLRKHRKMKGIRKWLYGIGMKFNLLPNPEFINGVCSRNIQMGPGDSNNFANYAREHNMLEGLANLNMNIAVQGELIAPSIQNNYEKVSGFEYHVYDIFDLDKQEYLVPSVARQITADLGLSYVPVISEATTLEGMFGDANVDASDMVKRILEASEGPGMNPGVKREGIVFKSNNSPVSFKAISNSYLLQKKD